jgi:tRNA G18 (ribose-2'-O)-methylase SpoU
MTTSTEDTQMPVLPAKLTLISNVDDPRIALYRSLRDTEALQAAHHQAHVFIVEGVTAVMRLLQSEFEVVSIFALPQHYNDMAEWIEARNVDSQQLFTASKQVMNEIVGFKLHVGLMAMARVPQTLDLDTCSREELRSFMQALAPYPPPILALNTLADAENVGAIIRTCAAFGVRSVLVDAATCSPYIRRAVRVSMGGIFSVRVITCTSLAAACGRLRSEAGFGIVAAEITSDAKPVHTYSFPERCVIVFGSEGAGVSPEVLHTSDAVVTIPMTAAFNDEIPSLNVGAAAAIHLYEAIRGRFRTLQNFTTNSSAK